MTTIQPNDNIQASIDSSASGDQIVFTGAHSFAGIQLRPGRAYLCADGAKITSTDYAFKLAGDGVTLKNITSVGPLLKILDPVNGRNYVNGLSIQTCDLSPKRGANDANKGLSEWAGICWNQSLHSAEIVGNKFHDIEAWTAVYGYGWVDLEISGNSFVNRQDKSNPSAQGRCIKLHGIGISDPNFPEGNDNTARLRGVCERLRVAGNLFSNFRGMAIEYQDGSLNDLFQDNYVELPIIWGSNENDNLDVYGFSIVATRSVGLKCINNDFRIGAQPLRCFRLAIELGGYGVACTGNNIDGTPGASIAVNGSNGSASITGNRLVNGAPQPQLANGAKATIANNSSYVSLPWSLTRIKPGAGAVTVQTNTTKTLSATATVKPTLGIDGGGIASIAFTGITGTPTQAKVSAVATGNAADPRGIVPEKTIAFANPLLVGNQPPGYRQTIKAMLLDAAGVVLGTVTVNTSEMPGESTSPWPIVTTPTQPTDGTDYKIKYNELLSGLKALVAGR